MPPIHKDKSRHDQVVPRQLHPNIASNAPEYDRAGVPEQFFHRMTFLAKPCFRLQEDRNGWAQAHLAVEGHFGGGEAQHSSDFLVGDLPPKVVLGCELSAYLADALYSLRDVLWQPHYARLLRDTPAHRLLHAQQPMPISPAEEYAKSQSSTPSIMSTAIFTASYAISPVRQCARSLQHAFYHNNIHFHSLERYHKGLYIAPSRQH